MHLAKIVKYLLNKPGISVIYLVTDFLVASETTLWKTMDKYNTQAQKLDT